MTDKTESTEGDPPFDPDGYFGIDGDDWEGKAIAADVIRGDDGTVAVDDGRPIPPRPDDTPRDDAGLTDDDHRYLDDLDEYHESLRMADDGCPHGE
jgi:hypothetical protein